MIIGGAKLSDSLDSLHAIAIEDNATNEKASSRETQHESTTSSGKTSAVTRGARSQVQNVETSREGHRQEETAAASERVLHESTTPPSDSMPEPADSTKAADASTKFWPSNLLDILEEVVKEQ